MLKSSVIVNNLGLTPEIGFSWAMAYMKVFFETAAPYLATSIGAIIAFSLIRKLFAYLFALLGMSKKEAERAASNVAGAIDANSSLNDAKKK